MSRSYKGVRLKKHRVYSVQALMSLYSVTANTVSNWVKSGLRPSDGKKPYLFRGEIVQQFHKARRERTRAKLRPGEFKCIGCKMAVFPEAGVVADGKTQSGAPLLSAQCPECSANMLKIGTDADLGVLRQSTDPNTSEGFRHEEKPEAPGGIGICEPRLVSPNDRTIYDWQRFAEKHSDKTVDRHLAAIRFLEDILGAKRFDKLTTDDISGVRQRLKDMLSGAAGERQSKSTVSHSASHMRAFLEWLIKQDGHKHLPKDLPDYLDLPRSAYATALPRKTRAFPSIKEAEGLLTSMPNRTVLHKRQRALFALAFLGALRADTLISLRIRHLIPDKRLIIQDADVTRAKNGKSLMIKWFPLQECFAEEVCVWRDLLIAKGFGPDDALFPDHKHLTGHQNHRQVARQSVLPMASQHAVTEAFVQACRGHSGKYTPHAAKHTIAAERDNRQLTATERKAWSLNMGHETEQITDTYYGRMTDETRMDVLDSIGTETEAPARLDLTDAEKIAFFDRFEEHFLSELARKEIKGRH